jgi:hypothetical protein
MQALRNASRKSSFLIASRSRLLSSEASPHASKRVAAFGDTVWTGEAFSRVGKPKEKT